MSCVAAERAARDVAVGATSYSGGCYSPASIGNISTGNVGCQLLDLTGSDATGVNLTLTTTSLTGLTITGTVTGPEGPGLPYIQVDAWDVTATSGFGTGPASDPSNSVTPAAPSAGATYHALAPTPAATKGNRTFCVGAANPTAGTTRLR